MLDILLTLRHIIRAPLSIQEILVRWNYDLTQAQNRTIQDTLDKLRASSRYQSDKSLTRFGYKVYSQNEEDGFIREIFNRIGVTNKVFIEFGVDDGRENNTLALLFDGWRGVWIEGSAKAADRIRTNFANTIKEGYLKIINSFITKDNINDLISSAIANEEIDLLSIDIDGNDFHVFEAISCVKPRVVVIEYNAKFPPPLLFCMDYNASHVWKGDDCFGASLKFLEIRLREKGYCLVGCNLIGINAFFVRADLVDSKFLEPYTAEQHYEPARYYLSAYGSSGHKPSYLTLEGSIVTRAAYGTSQQGGTPNRGSSRQNVATDL